MKATVKFAKGRGLGPVKLLVAHPFIYYASVIALHALFVALFILQAGHHGEKASSGTSLSAVDLYTSDVRGACASAHAPFPDRMDLP